MTKFSIVFIAFSIFAFSSCKDKVKETEPEVVSVDTTGKEKKVYELAKTEAVFNDPKVEAVFEQYLKVEKALVNTNAVDAASEASALQGLIGEVDDDPSTFMALEAIANTDDIEVQRHNFVALTTAMEDILDGALKSGTVYKQYCPMAFKNTGAFWFSNSKDILNPYFGDKMLKCGRVEAEIQ